MLAARPTRLPIYSPSPNINQWLRPASAPAQRRGINLVERHTRHRVTYPTSVDQQQRLPQVTRGPKTFQGLIIPEKPRVPTADECCMSRCDICVYDIYLTSLHAYREDISAVRRSIEETRVPRTEWPVDLQAEADLDARDHQAEERAVTEMAVRSSDKGKNDTSDWWAKEVWMETVKLTVWVLRGCKG